MPKETKSEKLGPIAHGLLAIAGTIEQTADKEEAKAERVKDAKPIEAAHALGKAEGLREAAAQIEEFARS